jgi:hypothetical protein
MGGLGVVVEGYPGVKVVCFLDCLFWAAGIVLGSELIMRVCILDDIGCWMVSDLWSLVSGPAPHGYGYGYGYGYG